MTRRVVPLDDLERLYAEQADEIRSAAEKVLSSGRYTFTKGKEVESFERAFAGYIGTGDCVGVSSGTAALWLALEALGIGPGDEVIVPANTYVASVFAISYLGATPVLADVDEATFTLDPAVVDTLITARTAALIPVHLFGAPCDMDALSRIAASAGLAIAEDAAQAHGATLHGKRVGTFGAAGCFSFYPTKNLGAMGDAGALTTDDPAVAASVRRQRYMGQEHKDEPLIYSVDVLPAGFVPESLTQAWGESLFVHLEQAGLTPTSSASIFRASHLPENIQELTKPGLDPFMPWLLMVQVHLAADGIPVLYSHDYYRGDRFSFEVLRRVEAKSRAL